MKRFHILFLFLSFFLSLPASAAYVFKSSSQLKSGKWVKVFTQGSGIYEIPYSDLRKMGFSDPSRVGVYGKGASPMSLNFCDLSGRPLVSDDIEPVAVMHSGDRLFFYAKGPVDMSFNNVQFDCVGTNLYSTKGAYFLTDKDESPLLMTVCEPVAGSKVEYKSGSDFIHHERDIFHNTTSTGQLYWGESLIDSTLYGWPIDIPYVDLSRSARMICKIYASPASSGTITFGVVNSEGNKSYKILPPSTSSFRTQSVTTASPSLRGDRAVVFVECADPAGAFINLDYWTFTYPKKVPDFTLPHSASQERLFISPNSTAQGFISLTTNRDITAFDVSDPQAPYILRNEKEGDVTKAFFNPSSSHNALVLCNMGEKQYSISGFEPVSNSDIHSMAEEGADMLIITVGRYYDYALRLAALHESLNNIKVKVFPLSEVYNEFSGGIPDPMAIRGVTKMFFNKGKTRLKNLLLFGPVYGDVRALEMAGDTEENIIGFQGTSVQIDSEAANVMDIYGLMDDYINTYSLYDNQMQVGVGVLPLYSEADAERCIRKTEKYLTDTDKAMMVNEFFSVGGTGDDHTHDNQAVHLIDSLYNNKVLAMPCVTPVLAIDAYGEKSARKKFIGNLNRGTLFTWYHGHASYYLLNNTKAFFTNADLPKLNNNQMGFLFIGGCDLSGTDWKRRGLGENFVTATDHGLAGVIMSPRTSWSGQNFTMAQALCTSMFNERGTASVKRKASPSIGEVYADMKSRCFNANDLNYILIGDPALRMPVPLGRLTPPSILSKRPGETVTISGSVTDLDGRLLKDFNGKVVAKLMAPPVSVMSADYETGTVQAKPDKNVTVTYMDDILAVFNGSASEGHYTVDVTLPASAASYQGQNLPVYLSAYDSKANLGVAECAVIPVSSAPLPGSADSQAPRIDAAYDQQALSLMIYLHDDHAVAREALSAEVDGNPVSSLINLSGDAAASVRSYLLPVRNLKPGHHSVRLFASDLSGNKAESSLDFTVEEWAPALSLSLEEAAVSDQAQFFYEGKISGAVELMILNQDGNTVYQAYGSEGHFTWNCRDLSGNALPKGLYKARVAGAAAGQKHLCSAWAYFAIM